MKLSTTRMFADLLAEATNLSRSGDPMLATSNRQMMVVCEILQEIIDEMKLPVVDDRTPEAIQAEQKIADAAPAAPAMPSQDQIGQLVANAVAQAIAQLTKPR